MVASLLVVALVLRVVPDGMAPSDAPVLPSMAVAPLPAASPAPTPRAVRVAVEVLVAGAAGLGIGAVGGWFGCLASQSPNGQTCSTGTVAAVGLTGFGLTVAAVVPLAGHAMGGTA